MPKYSVVIPIYNRPDEVDELLESLTKQTYTDFEVVVVEDGSEIPSKDVVSKYGLQISLKYFEISNSGPALARNYGAEKAHGKWLIFLDSDCFVDGNYLEVIDDFIENNQVKLFGGPDRDHISFTPIQRGISYAMTSILTTGGIRGSKNSLEEFKPRSFNMGIDKVVFKEIGGFRDMRFGEDIDLSLRVIEQKFQSAFIEEAHAYHRRRSTFYQFYKQIYNSGVARWVIESLHPSSMKLVHILPAAFLITHIFLLLAVYFVPTVGLLLIPFPLLVFFHSLMINKRINVTYMSVIAAFIQLCAYGIGFISGCYFFLRKKKIKHKFESNFYN